MTEQLSIALNSTITYTSLILCAECCSTDVTPNNAFNPQINLAGWILLLPHGPDEDDMAVQRG